MHEKFLFGFDCFISFGMKYCIIVVAACRWSFFLPWCAHLLELLTLSILNTKVKILFANSYKTKLLSMVYVYTVLNPFKNQLIHGFLDFFTKINRSSQLCHVEQSVFGLKSSSSLGLMLMMIKDDERVHKLHRISNNTL